MATMNGKREDGWWSADGLQGDGGEIWSPQGGLLLFLLGWEGTKVER